MAVVMERIQLGRKSKDSTASEGKGVLVRVSKDAVTILRRLSGFLEKPMSDVVSEMIVKHGKPELQRLMFAEQERFRKELK